MLDSKNKIFKNLYNDHGWEIDDALKREDWVGTKDLIKRGSENKKEINLRLSYAIDEMKHYNEYKYR